MSKVEDVNVIELGDVSFPSELPILPLRGVVVYPMMWLPLTVGQERSIRLVDDALIEAADRRFIGLVTARDPEVEEPCPEQIYDVGTVAVVHRMLQAPDGTVRLIVQGLERIRIKRYTQDEPYLRGGDRAAARRRGGVAGAGSAHAHGAGALPPAGVAGAAHAGGAGDGRDQRHQCSPARLPDRGQHPHGVGAGAGDPGARPCSGEAAAPERVPEQGAGGARAGPQDPDRRPRTR